MRKTIILVLLLAVVVLVVIPVGAQTLQLPRVSQKGVVSQTIGLTDVTVTYFRPGVKGRQIWGGLVPYDKVWRTGANEATTIAFSDDVTIEGKPLPKGTYSLHTIPTAGEWTVVFNGVANQWGSFSYDAAKDALRVSVKPQKAPFTEWLTFDFTSVSTDAATLAIRWADLAVPININAGTTAKVMATLRTAVAAAKPDDASTPMRAASFAFDNGLNEDASRWLDASLKISQTMSSLWLKARMEQKAGHIADAVRYGGMAFAKKTDKDNADLAAEIRRQVDGWKK